MAEVSYEQFQEAYKKRMGSRLNLPDPSMSPQPSATPATGEAPADTSTPGGFYTQNIGGPANDYLRNFMAQALPGHPLNDIVANMAAPETLTDAAVTAGTLLAPEARAGQYFGSEARMASKVIPTLDRLAAPVGAGALGGFAEKGDAGDALKGAGIGLAVGVPAETASFVSRWYAGNKLAQRFFKEDPEAMRAVMTKIMPEIGKTLDPENLGRSFFQGAAQEQISNIYDKKMTTIADAAMARAPVQAQAADILQSEVPLIGPRGVVTSPRIRELQSQGVLGKNPPDVEGVMQSIRDLRLKGRTSDGDPKLTLDGRQARDYASEISADLAEALKNQGPDGVKLAKQYQKTDQRYAKGAEMIRYLKQPEIVDDNGTLNMKLLQTQMKTERAYGLTHAFSDSEFKDLMDTVFRGGNDTVVDQILKPNQHAVRLHASESGRLGVFGDLLSLFRNNKYAGNYDVGFLKPKGPQLLLQRLGSGAFQGLNKPLGGSANPLVTQDDTENP